MTATATPTKVILPPAATAHTEEGAKAFAAFYVHQIDVSARDADTEAMRALADPSCGGCNSMISLVESRKRRGEHHASLSLSVAGAFVSPYSTPDMVVIDVLIDDRGGTTVDADGRAIVKSPAAKFTLRNTLKWRQSGWVVMKSVLV